MAASTETQGQGIDAADERLPIFVTASIPPEVLEDFLTVMMEQKREHGQGVHIPSIMATTSFQDLLQSFTLSEARPFLNRGSPFLSWTPFQLHEFFCGNCDKVTAKASESMDGQPKTFDPFPAGTFAMLDDKSGEGTSSPYHRTVLLCTNLPDFHEGNKFYLKTTRVLFEDLLTEANCIELLLRCLSEVGKGTVLSVQPLAMFTGGIRARRQTISFGVKNDNPWTEEHLKRQPGEKGFESERIIPKE